MRAAEAGRHRPVPRIVTGPPKIGDPLADARGVPTRPTDPGAPESVATVRSTDAYVGRRYRCSGALTDHAWASRPRAAAQLVSASWTMRYADRLDARRRASAPGVPSTTELDRRGPRRGVSSDRGPRQAGHATGWGASASASGSSSRSQAEEAAELGDRLQRPLRRDQLRRSVRRDPRSGSRSSDGLAPTAGLQRSSMPRRCEPRCRGARGRCAAAPRRRRAPSRPLARPPARGSDVVDSGRAPTPTRPTRRRGRSRPRRSRRRARSRRRRRRAWSPGRRWRSSSATRTRPVERHEHAEVQEGVGVVQHPEHRAGGHPRHHQDGDGRPSHPDDRQRLGQEEHDRAIAVRRGSPDSRATRAALLIWMAARLRRCTVRRPPRAAPSAEWPHRHDATVTSAERTVIRTTVERPPPRGTRKRRPRRTTRQPGSVGPKP